MIQYRENFKLYEKVFELFIYTLTFRKIHLLIIFKEQKNKECGHSQICKHAIFHLSQISIIAT